jgi:hypothetical protein
MKKSRVKVFMAFLIVLLSLTPSYGNAVKLNGSEKITPMFSNINLLRSTFDISISGKAINTAYLDARNVDKVVIEAYLQQYKGGKWITIKDWSNSKSGTSCSIGWGLSKTEWATTITAAVGWSVAVVGLVLIAAGTCMYLDGYTGVRLYVTYIYEYDPYEGLGKWYMTDIDPRRY